MIAKVSGDIKTWIEPKVERRDNPGQLTVKVGVIGTSGIWEFPWDHNDPLGGHHSAALKVAQQMGFVRVEEVGVNKRGMGFTFRPYKE